MEFEVASWLPESKPEPPGRASVNRRVLTIEAALLALLLLVPLIAVVVNPAFLFLLALVPLLGVIVFTKRAAIEPLELDAFPPREQDFAERVKLEIVQDGAITGRDYGWFWIQESAIFFAGRSCSFVLPGQNLLIPPKHHRELEPLSTSSGGSFDIYFVCRDREVRLHFNIFSTEGVTTAAANLGRRASALLGRTSHRKAVFPPLDLQTGIRLSWSGRARATLAGAVLMIGLYALFMAAGAHGIRYLCYAMLYGVASVQGLVKPIRRGRVLREIAQESGKRG